MVDAGRGSSGVAHRVLVTGGARGLGRATCLTLAASGHDVTFTYNASAPEAEKTLAELREIRPDGTFEARSLNLADRDALDEFVTTLDDERPFYGLVHNAGMTSDSLAAVIDQDRAEVAMQVNFWSLTRLTAGVVRRMTRARSGRIVMIGSVIALRGSIGNSIYGASKSAMLGYMRTLALETAKRGVTVNYIAPGFIDTNMLAPYANYREHMESQIPLGRFADPAEIAAMVDFLMSPIAGYITGAVLPVDGGLTASIPVHR